MAMDSVSFAYARIEGEMPDLTAAQRRDIEALHLGKRRNERAAVYNLINQEIGYGLLILHREDGSPYLADPEGAEMADISFSLSHSAHYVAIAYCRGAENPVGIDIEEPTERLEKVAPKFLSAKEMEMFGTLQLKLTGWTIKEAVYKAALTPGLSLTPGIEVVEHKPLIDKDLFTARDANGNLYRVETYPAGEAMIAVAQKLSSNCAATKK